MTELRPLSVFDAFFLSEGGEVLEKCRSNWHLIHSHYPMGWEYDFMEPNRFLNRAIFHHMANMGVGCTVLDFGCYDGMLVASLIGLGLDAYGYESNPCVGMYEALGIAGRVNTRKHCEAVVAFGVAQEYSFPDLLARITEENDGLPDVIFFDREPSRDTIHNKAYFDPMFAIREGIQVVKFPNCVSDRSRAELLIWRRNADHSN